RRVHRSQQLVVQRAADPATAVLAVDVELRQLEVAARQPAAARGVVERAGHDVVPPLAGGALVAVREPDEPPGRCDGAQEPEPLARGVTRQDLLEALAVCALPGGRYVAEIPAEDVPRLEAFNRHRGVRRAQPSAPRAASPASPARAARPARTPRARS